MTKNRNNTTEELSKSPNIESDKLQNDSFYNKLGCMAKRIVLYLIAFVALMLVSWMVYHYYCTKAKASPITLGGIVIFWVVVIGIIYLRHNKGKKMSKKELNSCLQSMNCTLPDFKIINQSYKTSLGWESGGTNYVWRTFDIKFKKWC